MLTNPGENNGLAVTVYRTGISILHAQCSQGTYNIIFYFNNFYATTINPRHNIISISVFEFIYIRIYNKSEQAHTHTYNV